jgi:hypothetical protein
MTDDKKKPPTSPKPPPSQEDVSATLIACGAGQDPSSRRISAGIIADNIKDGKKGADILSATRGISDNVGSCVANFYDDKPPTFGERVSGWLASIMNTAGEVRSSVSAAVDNAAIKPGQGPTSVSIHNNTTARNNPEAKL